MRQSVLSSCLFFLLLTTSLFAATQNAVVYGTVYDRSGNPIAGADVKLENASLGFLRTTTTASDGSYSFAEVPPSSGYRVVATRAGQTLDIRSGITVNVGDERVILPPLTEQVVSAAAGAAKEVVEKKVEGQEVQAEAISTAVSGVITGEQLRTLPLYNRNFLVLGLLTPNVHDPEAHNPLGSASFSVSGNRPASNNFLLDGVDNVASSSNQAIPFQVNDAIQEFRVISSTAAAEYGRGAGGVVNVVTGRGGNKWHGNVFGYFGNDALNADNPLSVYNGSGFDRAAAYAGPVDAAAITTPVYGFFSPNSYNQYVATAEANGYCTNSIGVADITQPTRQCFIGGTVAPVDLGVTGNNTRFNPAAILATENEFKQPFDSKQFGINIGGPLKKDKVFIFGSYEGTRINNPNPVFERVPSAFDKTYNPLLARAVPGALPYDAGFDALNPDFGLAQSVLALYPDANVAAVPDVLEFYRGEAPNYTHVHNFMGRVDVVQSENTSWTARYVLQDLSQLHDATLPATANYAGNGALRDALNQSLSVTVTHSFTPRIVNEVRGAFTRFRVDETAQDAGLDSGLPGGVPTMLLSGLDQQYSGGRNAQADLGAVGNGAFGGWMDQFWAPLIGVPVTTSPMLPTLDGLFPLARIGAPFGTPGQRRDTTFLLGDSLTISTGKHTVRLGAEWRLLKNRFFDGSQARGSVVASNLGEFLSDSGTCNETCAAFALPQNAYRAPSFDWALRQPAPYEANFSSYAFSWFVQDTWRVHPRVTMNFGIRWDYFSNPEEKNDLIWNYDPQAHGLVQQGHDSVVDPFGSPCALSVPYQANPPDLQFNADWDCNPRGTPHYARIDKSNFAPRVGVAWDVFGSGKTVLRGGVGLFYDQLPVMYAAQLMYNRPTLFDPANPQATYGLTFPFNPGGACPDGLHCGTGNTAIDPANIVNPNVTSASSPNPVYARDLNHSDTPYTRQISASLQQSLTSNVMAELGYVGTSARELPVVSNSGFANEWFCTGTASDCDTFSYFPVFTMTNRARSSYHSLVARLRAAEWHGLRFNTTYTWSKGLDNASNAGFSMVNPTLFNTALAFQFNGTGNPAGWCLVFLAQGGSPLCANVTSLPPAASLPSTAVTTTGERPILTTPYQIPQDWQNFLVDDYGRSDFDSRHRVVVDYTWQIPSLEKAFGAPKWLDNWTLSGTVIGQTGQPFTIFSGPAFGEFEQRVNVDGPVSVTNRPEGAIDTTNLSLPGPACQALGGNPYAIPGPGGSLFDGTKGTACVGNSGRNEFTGPGLITVNLAIQKGFEVFGEGRLLTFRTEFYNLLDRANYYNPISTASFDGFSLNPQFGKIKSAHDPRQIQFALRFSW